MADEVVYLDTDGVFDKQLKSDGSAYALDNITKVVLMIEDELTITNESSTAWPIKWTGLGTDGKMQFLLGDQEITAGHYVCTLILYDATHTDGYVWGTFEIVVKSLPA